MKWGGHRAASAVEDRDKTQDGWHGDRVQAASVGPSVSFGTTVPISPLTFSRLADTVRACLFAWSSHG